MDKETKKSIITGIVFAVTIILLIEIMTACSSPPVMFILKLTLTRIIQWT